MTPSPAPVAAATPDPQAGEQHGNSGKDQTDDGANGNGKAKGGGH